MNNCLAGSQDYAANYQRQLRSGMLEFFVIEGMDDASDALITVYSGGDIEQVKGPGNCRPIESREAIIELLLDREFTVNEHDDLLRLGICDELLTAPL